MVVLYVGGQNLGPLTRVEDVTKLMEAGQAFEVRNETGRTLGRFAPVEPICPWDPTLTREEIDRRCRESKRSSLDDILKRLGAE